MKRAMLGISLRERILNEEIRRLGRAEDVTERIEKAKWQWPEKMNRNGRASECNGSQELRGGAQEDLRNAGWMIQRR